VHIDVHILASIFAILTTTVNIIFILDFFIHNSFRLEMPAKKAKRYEEVTEAGHTITSLIQDCQKYFQCSEDLPAWHKYLTFVDQIVVNGILRSAASSLGYLIDETDPTITQGPLIEASDILS
jgi:hypothetical protein